jgi:predicted TIM-barrel fold metal-dependent hydrolase
MNNYLIVDAHLHTYPTAAIGEQALQGAGRSGRSGTVEELLPCMAEAGISYAVMANTTPTYDMKMAALEKLPPNIANEERERAENDINKKMVGRMQRRNLWTCTVGKENPGLVPLIGVDMLQAPSEMELEIEQGVREHGAKGLKLHPVSNRFLPDDRSLWAAYSKAAETAVPILFHSGGSELAGYAEADYARPRNFGPVLQAFPKLTIVLAHMGNGFFDESEELAQNHDNVYFDTSAIISLAETEGGLSDVELARLIRRIGVDRVLFGSDWPWFPPLPGIERIKNLDLTEEEKQDILGRNAARVYNLDKLPRRP